MEEYQILQQVGKGSFGSVYKVKAKDGEILAIKQVICSDLKAANQAISEIFTIHNLRHENLIDYRKLFLTSTNNNLQLCVNVVMPFYSKGDLEGYIGSLYKSGLKLRETELIDYSLQILSSISYLHQNMVMHRDLKPANVFITDENGKTSLKIGDFGLSTKVGMENFKTSVVGTQAYCAPEVFRQMYSFSVDMFSFGAILYKMLTGKERVFFMELYQNPNTLKEMKNEIEKSYDSFWYDLVVILLDVHPDKRPNAETTKKMIKDYEAKKNGTTKKDLNISDLDLPPLPQVQKIDSNSNSFKNQENFILQHLDSQHKKSQDSLSNNSPTNQTTTQMLPLTSTKPLTQHNSQPLLQLDNFGSNSSTNTTNNTPTTNGSGGNYPMQNYQPMQPTTNYNQQFNPQQVQYYQKQQQQLQQQQMYQQYPNQNTHMLVGTNALQNNTSQNKMMMNKQQYPQQTLSQQYSQNSIPQQYPQTAPHQFQSPYQQNYQPPYPQQQMYNSNNNNMPSNQNYFTNGSGGGNNDK